MRALPIRPGSEYWDKVSNIGVSGSQENTEWSPFLEGEKGNNPFRCWPVHKRMVEVRGGGGRDFELLCPYFNSQHQMLAAFADGGMAKTVDHDVAGRCHDKTAYSLYV